MNKDRGTKKWIALMLPEHVARLREWNEEEKKVTPVEKSDWELADIQQTIYQSFTQQAPITLTVYRSSEWTTYEGIIQKIAKEQQVLFLQTNNELKQIHFDSIQAAQVAETFD